MSGQLLLLEPINLLVRSQCLFLLVVLNSIVGNVSSEPYGLRFLEMFEYILSLKLPQLLPLPQYQEFCDNDSDMLYQFNLKT